jgi:hypothetical protein
MRRTLYQERGIVAVSLTRWISTSFRNFPELLHDPSGILANSVKFFNSILGKKAGAIRRIQNITAEDRKVSRDKQITADSQNQNSLDSCTATLEPCKPF